ncbi:DNA replication and repair protein RecF [Candidatus Gottesmanbacteria bacterium]|nr:DNA replication and repair protein RecF [Candidatus Gottesmanbacteria bacterium]
MLTSLALHNFRSYTKKAWAFSQGVTCIVGPNAAGKTNVLEAIMLLATGKSFRAGIDREVIRWESEVARVIGQSGDEKVEIVLTPGVVSGQKSPLKKHLVNGIPRRVIDFVGNVRAVLFWPEDLEIVTDSPSIRRRYLDTVLVQVDREYRRNLLSYERGVRQRNRLLDSINEGTASRSQLLFWDQLLIRAGGYITQKRGEYITFVNSTALADHHFMIMYDKSVISEARLLQYKDEEVAAKSTLVGPHRDDFGLFSQHHTLTSGYRDLNKFGSRGEQRLGVLWLKLAELSYIEKKTGERPMLLLDDIFSELDEEHRKLVGNIVDRQQTVITSADIESVPKHIRKSADIVAL